MSTSKDRMSEQEANLTDLWQMVWRRKWIVFGAVALGMGLALAYGELAEPVYEYRAVIELGTVPSNSDRHTPIEPSENVVAKLNDEYIPRAFATSKGKKSAQRISMKAYSPQKSDMVIIKGAGSAQAATAIGQVANLAVTTLQQDHDRVLAPHRDQLQFDIEEQRNAKRELEEELGYLQSSLQRLDTQRSLLEDEIQGMEQLLHGLNQHPDLLEDAETSLSYLVIASEVRSSRERLFELRQELQIGLSNERDKVEKSLVEVTHSIEEKGTRIEALQSRLANMPRTRLLSEPMRSNNAKGPSMGTMLSLGLMGGLVVGLFVALAAESLRRFKVDEN